MLVDLGFGINQSDVQSSAVKPACTVSVENLSQVEAGLFKACYTDLTHLQPGTLEQNRMGALMQPLATAEVSSILFGSNKRNL